mgnify:CR=1 FL=1
MKSSVYSSVSEAVMAARGAFGRYSELTLNERNEILEAVRTAVRPKIAELAEMTVAETGMGNVADKIEKLKLAVEKTPGIEDLITEVNTGDHGMTLYELSAFGVICAVHPCTNPCATLISNTIGMLAAGNAGSTALSVGSMIPSFFSSARCIWRTRIWSYFSFEAAL